jgi:hypothetical protein
MKTFCALKQYSPRPEITSGTHYIFCVEEKVTLVKRTAIDSFLIS